MALELQKSACRVAGKPTSKPGSKGALRALPGRSSCEALAAAKRPDPSNLRVRGVAFARKGKGERVASCGDDGYVRVFDASSGARLASAEHGGGSVWGVSFSPDGGRVACAGICPRRAI